MIRVLMLHVGNAVERASQCQDPRHAQRYSLLDRELLCFDHADIVNADDQMNAVRAAGVEVAYGHVSIRRSIAGLVRLARHLRAVTSSGDVDVVHALWGSTLGAVAVLASRRPVVISLCGSDLLGTKDAAGRMTWGGWISRQLSRWAASRAAANITKSQAMKDDLPMPARERTAVVPNGVDVTVFRPMPRADARRALALDPDRPVILFFYSEGQSVKNPALADASVALVRAVWPDLLYLRVSGKSREELALLYNAADVMLLTSFHEGSNNSLKEAVACGLPVVSVRAGDAAERLAGVEPSTVVDHYDPRVIADAVLAILRSRRRSSGPAAIGEITLAASARRIKAVYESVLTR